MLERADLQAAFNTWWLNMFTFYFRTKFYVFNCIGSMTIINKPKQIRLIH